ncbi:MAG: DUF4198 domain-containing protein [Acidobacteriota bacterium]
MSHNWIRTLLVAACGIAALPSVKAHYLWIERSGTHATLFFGEYEESAREQSPGRLDEIPGPRAHILSGQGAQPAALQKRANGFVFPSLDTKAQPLVAEETGVGVKDWTRAGVGVVKPYFYARHQPPRTFSGEPALTLDILPERETGQFRVYFRGQPLPKALVKIVAPNTWAQEGHTDANGRVQLPLPWKGQYILQVIHLEPGRGEYDGQPYEAQRHRATLTYVAGGTR